VTWRYSSRKLGITGVFLLLGLQYECDKAFQRILSMNYQKYFLTF
jgi:hypothetical protein